MAAIDKCQLIRRRTEKQKKIKRYNLQELIDTAEIDSAALDCHKSQISGVTVKEYPSLLYVLDIIDKEGLESEFQNVTFCVAESLSVKGHLSPLLTSLDIKSDTSMKIKVNGDWVTFFAQRCTLGLRLAPMKIQ